MALKSPLEVTLVFYISLRTCIDDGVYTKNKEGTGSCEKTPLFLACALSKGKIVTLLLNSGASAKVKDCFDNTPLHFAFVPSIVSSLVDKGAHMNAANMDGMTPMHVMSAFGLSETVSCLRAFGAKENVKNKNGNTPQDVFNLIPPKDWYICLPFFKFLKGLQHALMLTEKPKILHTICF